MPTHGNPNWKQGVSGNPSGRPSAERAALRKAMEKAAKVNGDKSFLQHFVERAYLSDVVAVALARKILPDMTETDFGAETIQSFIDIIKRAGNAKRGADVQG